MKIICFGDSNTWGYDPRSYLGERYPKDVRWTGLLSALPGLEVVNCGVNGRTIPNTPLASAPPAPSWADTSQPTSSSSC